MFFPWCIALVMLTRTKRSNGRRPYSAFDCNSYVGDGINAKSILVFTQNICNQEEDKCKLNRGVYKVTMITLSNLGPPTSTTSDLAPLNPSLLPLPSLHHSPSRMHMFGIIFRCVAQRPPVKVQIRLFIGNARSTLSVKILYLLAPEPVLLFFGEQMHRVFWNLAGV
jgi:hypothetical protein